MYLDDEIKKYMESVYKKTEEKVVLRQVGLNKNGKERILLYATAGVNLCDYAVCIYQVRRDKYYYYQFRKDEVLSEDTYVCLFTDSSQCNAIMKGVLIPSFHMNENENILHINDIVSVLKVSKVSRMRVVEV